MEPYWYRARIVSVYDGDSVRADVDLGFKIWQLNKPVRLFGIDAPELRGDEREAGLAARDYLRSLVLDREVLLKTEKDKTGKYGRLLGTIFLPAGVINEPIEPPLNVNLLMIDEGHAVAYG